MRTPVMCILCMPDTSARMSYDERTIQTCDVRTHRWENVHYRGLKGRERQGFFGRGIRRPPKHRSDLLHRTLETEPYGCERIRKFPDEC
jgi:hypothetical protein